jgi:putative ABC transport system permease protein
MLELRLAARSLRRDWTYTVPAIAMLALAIALNITVFTIVTAMFFGGYPHVKRSDRIVYVQEIAPSGLRGVSFPDFEEWSSHTRAFEGMGLLLSGSRVPLRTADGRSTDLEIYKITANAFGVLGVAPFLGRDFSPGDARPGAPHVAILNYTYWNSRFGKQPDVVGSTILVDSVPTTVIGVMPERFDFPAQFVNAWVPVVVTAPLQDRSADSGGYLAFGRLNPHATVTQARVELETINAQIQAAFPAMRRAVTVIDNARYNGGPNGPALYGSLWAGAWFVLLIACANLSNLTLLRALGRWRDFTTRVTLGASPWQTLRQTLVEAAIVTAAAAALGWRIAVWAVHDWIVATASPYQIVEYRVDASTFAYLIGISAIAAFLFLLGPLVRLVQLHRVGDLSNGARGATQPPGIRRFGATLVAGQMALAMVLLSGAGVLVRSLLNIVNADTGVRNPGNVLAGSVRLPSAKYTTPEQRIEYIDRLSTHLAQLPGVQDVAISSGFPVRGAQILALALEGTSTPRDGDTTVRVVWVTPNYFRTLGGSITDGRDFDPADRIGAPSVAIVNQSFVDTFSPGRGPLATRLRVAKPRQSSDWRTIVGIASNIIEGDPTRQHFSPVVYVPFRQEPLPHPYFLARSHRRAGDLARPARSEIERIDSDATIDNLTTLNAFFAFDGDYTDVDHMALGKNAAATPVLASIALLLAAIGLYAVVAHSVSQRTKEIGIRMALGAAAPDVRRMVFREGMSPAAIGLALGIAGGLATNRILQSQLVGVKPYDAATMTAAPMLLMFVAWCACVIPVRRAVTIDPAVALRHD